MDLFNPFYSYFRGCKVVEYLSWGRFPLPQAQTAIPLTHANFLFPQGQTSLPRGCGRSYGDSCLNSHGILLLTKPLDNFISFDESTGILTCESGVSLETILHHFVPRGWFLPVTPGTKYVSLGGAIANDIHGKNHHSAGNFGHHVLQLNLRRSDQADAIVCSPQQNADLFKATLGGLGLTGIITQARIQLKKISSAWIDQESTAFSGLESFFQLSKESDQKYEYSVAWVDLVGSKNIRGIYFRGNHSQNKELSAHSSKKLTFPFLAPEFLLNAASVKTFNHLYFSKNKWLPQNHVHYDPFFYPLDKLHHWNKVYGRRGFLQYQFVLPWGPQMQESLEQIIFKLKQADVGSFLSVLKVFGDIPSLGLMSFPKSGVTLALDFPYSGGKLLKILDECDAIVAKLNGSVYLAKDARMSRSVFSQFYPRLGEFKSYIDPQLRSDLWKRLI